MTHQCAHAVGGHCPTVVVRLRGATHRWTPTRPPHARCHCEWDLGAQGGKEGPAGAGGRSEAELRPGWERAGPPPDLPAWAVRHCVGAPSVSAGRWGERMGLGPEQVEQCLVPGLAGDESWGQAPLARPCDAVCAACCLAGTRVAWTPLTAHGRACPAPARQRRQPTAGPPRPE